MAGKPKVTIRDRDRGLRDVLNLGKTLKHGFVKVGVIGGKGKADEERGEGLTNVKLAAIHEFGAPDQGIPERSFIRAGVDAHREEYQAMLVDALKKAILKPKEMNIERALGLIGAKAASDVKKFVADGKVRPQNSLETAMRKLNKPTAKANYQARLDKGQEGPPGPPRALIDTGRLIGSITWQVVTGLGKKKR